MKRRYLEEEDFPVENVLTNVTEEEEEYGCKFCWDKRKNKSKELFFLDAANNIRVCHYCPYCGREYE